MPKNPQDKILLRKHAEKVMVVAREELFANEIWNGLKTENIQKYLNLIIKKHKFLPRGEVESDPKWKQIIPYLIFENRGKVFLMRRKADHSDLRLANNYSLGVGGHLNRKDIDGTGIVSWAMREFADEIDYKGKYKSEVLGLLNHDANDVGMVHLGVVVKLLGDSDQIFIKNELKSGQLVDMDEAGKVYKQMETWSQITYDYLREGTSVRSGQVLNSQTGNIINTEVFSGILPDWLIIKYIKEGAIKITPLAKNWLDLIAQVSIDFHLGSNIKLFRGGTYRYIDTRRGLPEDAMEEVNLIEGDPFILEPGAFAIATTRESLKLPSDIVGRLEGKSSLARLGIIVHSTAARFDPGWDGAPVLELGNLGPKPAILYSGMPVCAFTFEKIGAPVKAVYHGRYVGQNNPLASRIGSSKER